MTSLIDSHSRTPIVANRRWYRIRRVWKSNLTFLVAAGIILVTLGLGLFVVITDGGGQNQAPTSPASPVWTIPSDQDPSIPVLSPPGINWQEQFGVFLPYAPRIYGPAVVKGGLAVGFSHTPRGALLALFHAKTRIWADPNNDWQAELEQAVAPGPGRDELISMRRTANFTPPAEGWRQILAFKFVNYSPQVATISLATNSDPFTPYGWDVADGTVRWSEQAHDWQLVLEPTGADSPTDPVTVSSLPGYTPFGITAGRGD